MITPAFADKYIKPFNHRDTLVKMDYDTRDIIKTVLEADKDAYKHTGLFAKNLKYSDLEDLCKQLFDFLLYNIRYKEDELGSQLVKKPSALWYLRHGDCKSYSVFIASVLKNLRIPYTYRFVSFLKPGIYTHVYVIAHGKGKNIIIDAVYKRFNQEKAYQFKKDYYMKGLHMIGNTGDRTPSMLNFRKPLDELSEADIEMEIIRQRAEIEKDIISGWRGVGSAKVAEYERLIKGIGQIQDAVLSGNTNYIAGFIDGHPDTIGKIQLKKILKKVATPIKKAAKGFVKVNKAIVKATIVKPTKLLVKATKAVTMLPLKAGIEVALPAAAPTFLYLFVNDPNLIKKLPEKARKKRSLQVKFADFVVKAVGMKRNHFMGILRNGIMKRYKMSPEKKIAQLMKIPESQVKGHAMGDIGIISDILKAVVELIKMIVKLFKKKAPKENPNEMVPDESDFGEVTNEQATQLAKEVKQQPDAVEPGEIMEAGKQTSTSEKSDSVIPSDGGRKGFLGIS